MARFLVSFDAGTMVISEADLPAVSDAAHAVVAEAKAAGVWIHGGGVYDDGAAVVGTDGSVAPLPASKPHVGGFSIVKVASRADAHAWAAKFAVACRCPQEVGELGDDPAARRTARPRRSVVRSPYGRPVPSRTRTATYARRRRRRMAKVDNDLTAAQWAALKQAWGGCAYCGSAGPGLQKDCLLPISRGGRYTLANVVPACRSCNASKCNTEVTVWMRRKKLEEREFLVRQAEVLASLDADATATEEAM